MEQIYLGRIVAIAVSPKGKTAALYRVSSRSFPNRIAQIADDGRRIAIIPKPGCEADVHRNPYIAYNCARIIGDKAILANGSHTDPVAEKIAMGMPVRDAIALSLLAMDYEKDDFSTPRIVAVAAPGDREGWLGTIRRDGLDVRSFSLAPGTILHLSTYDHDTPDTGRISSFMAETAAEACEFILGGGVFSAFANAVTAVAAVAGERGFEMAVMDA